MSLLLLLALPSTSSASAPEAVTQNIDAVEDFIRKGGAAPAPAVPAEQLERIRTADALSLSEHRPMPNQASSAQLHDELARLRRKAGFIPKASKFMTGLAAGTGVIGSALMAGTIGWEIGQGINALYMEPELATDVTAGDEHLRLCSTCELYAEGADAGSFGSWVGFPEPLILALQAEQQLWRLHWTPVVDGEPQTGQVISQWSQWDNPSCQASYGAQPAVPEGIGPTRTGLAKDTCPGNPTPDDRRQWTWFGDGENIPKVKRPARKRNVSDPSQNPAVTTTVWPGSEGEGLGGETASAIVRDELGKTSEYPVLTQWLDAKLGGPSTDPTGQTVAIPSPLAGETATEYVNRLQGLGLHGTIVVLTEAAADASRGPNVVVRTDPRQGRRVDTDTNVEVQANPATMPEVPPGEGTGGGTTPPPPGPADGSGSGCQPWVTPAIDLDPLKVPLGTVFPFGIPFYVADTLDALVGEPITPSWTFEFPYVDGDGDFTVSLAIFNDQMPAIRAVLLVVALVSMAWLFLGLAMGGGNNASTGRADD